MPKHVRIACILLYAFSSIALAQHELEGTSWQAVKFVGGDGTVTVHKGGTKFTVSFGAGGKFSTEISCNIGGGSWSSDGPNTIKISNMVSTLTGCHKYSKIERVGGGLANVTKYLIKDGRLFLSLPANGGTFEMEPLSVARTIVTGAIIRENDVTVPADATVFVQLLDVTRAGATPAVINEQSFETNEKDAPLVFEIGYDTDKINSRGTYVIRVQIFVNGKLTFTTKKSYRVITRGDPTRLKVIVQRV